jgi:ribulose-5-phosphate 4-epimerase/fuculose-1-phosphate aldolase
MNEFDARDLIVEMARSMFERRLTFGSSGNISVKIDEGWLMTPTGSSLGRLDPQRLSKLDDKGTDIRDAPTKEAFFISPCTASGQRRCRGSSALHPFRCRVVPGRYQP